MKIIDNVIWHDGQKIGWIEGSHIHDHAGNKLGYFESDFVYNHDAHKVAYIHENQLVFENGQPSIPLEHINNEIVGTVPLLEKCAVHVLLED